MAAPEPIDRNSVPVVVAVDVEDEPDLLDPLIVLAQAGRWAIHLVHVAADGDPPAELGGMVDRLRGQGIEVDTRVVVGPTVETILNEAAGVGAAMTVVFGRKHTMARRIVLGSVAGAVVRQSVRPVLVLPVAQDVAEAPAGDEALAQLVEVIDRQDVTGDDLRKLRDLAQAQLDVEDEDEDRSIADQLRASLERFETDHPSLTRAISDVSYYLSGMGI